MKEPTTIVIYQRHKIFGQLNDRPDAYDYAAERKVVEKIKDLVEQFRELGPQFRVVTLDVEEEDYNDKLTELTKEAKELRDALESAPENSIFFHARGKVQRLSFNEFYLLDKTASREDNGGRGNLVLHGQGVEPFAHKVLNLEHKRPRIAIPVIHEVLTTESQEELGLAGLKKALESHGFEVRDIILKKWSRLAPPEPAVYTYDENKLDRLEERVKVLDTAIKNMEQAQQQIQEVRELWKTSSLEELTKKYAAQLRARRVKEVDDKMRQAQLEAIDEELSDLQMALASSRKRRDAADAEKGQLNVEELDEQRRMADLKSKMDRLLADCDLLLLPRMTLRNVNVDFENIPYRLYRLDPAQVQAIQEFLKAGKPVLVCFGPSNSPDDQPDSPDAAGADNAEELLAKLGIKFGKQTILFDVENESFAEGRSGLLFAGSDVLIPALDFDWKPGTGLPLGQAFTDPEIKPNPIRESLSLTARSMGQGQSLDLHLRHPRPVYYEPFDPSITGAFLIQSHVLGHAACYFLPVRQGPKLDPYFLMTGPASWNDDQPFPSIRARSSLRAAQAERSDAGNARRKAARPVSHRCGAGNPPAL